MSLWSDIKAGIATLDADAKTALKYLSIATLVGSKVEGGAAKGLSSVVDLITNPAKAATDGTAQTVINGLANILGAIALIPEPLEPEIATAAAVLKIIGMEEPAIVASIEFFIGIGALDKISQSIMDREDAEYRQLDPQGDVFKMTPQNDERPTGAVAGEQGPDKLPDSPSGMRPQN